MKKLTLVSHTGEILLELEVFVDGQDFKWESPNPTAYWLGEIHLKEATEMPVREKALADVELMKQLYAAQEERFYESKEVNNQDTGDKRVSKASKPKSIKDIFTRRRGGYLIEGNQGTRDRETTKDIMGGRT